MQCTQYFTKGKEAKTAPGFLTKSWQLLIEGGKFGLLPVWKYQKC